MQPHKSAMELLALAAECVEARLVVGGIVLSPVSMQDWFLPSPGVASEADVPESQDSTTVRLRSTTGGNETGTSGSGRGELNAFYFQNKMLVIF
jgi:hypothetical protein